MSILKSTISALIGATFLFGLPISSALAGEGEKAYKRCAACHLPTGKGVPSTFPPIANRLTGLMDTVEGRAYLVMVTSKGLMGGITVDSVSYNSIMPPQGRMLGKKGIADVLNYIALELSAPPAGFVPFTEDEVAKTEEAHPKFNGRKVHKLRDKLFSSKSE